MSIDYGETVIQAAEEIAVALKELTYELQQLRKTDDGLLLAVELLVKVQTNRP